MTPPKKKIYELLKAFSTGMLTTVEHDGTPRARPMAIAGLDEEGEILLVTADESKKVHEIMDNSHVGFSCQDDRRAYLTISGTARLSRDRAVLREVWTKEFEAWFPKGPDDPSAALLVITPDRGEYWDDSGLHKAVYLYEAAKAYFRGEAPPAVTEERHAKTMLP